MPRLNDDFSHLNYNIDPNITSIYKDFDSIASPQKKGIKPLDTSIKVLVDNILDFFEPLGKSAPEKADYLIGKLTQLQSEIQAAKDKSLGALHKYQRIDTTKQERIFTGINDNLEDIIEQMKRAKEAIAERKQEKQDYTYEKKQLAELMNQVKELMVIYQFSKFNEVDVIRKVGEDASKKLEERVSKLKDVYKDSRFRNLAEKVEKVKGSIGKDKVHEIDTLENEFDTYEQEQLLSTIDKLIHKKLEEKFSVLFSPPGNFIKLLDQKPGSEIRKFKGQLREQVMPLNASSREESLGPRIDRWLDIQFNDDAKLFLQEQVNKEAEQIRQNWKQAITDTPDKDKYPIQNLQATLEKKIQVYLNQLNNTKDIGSLSMFQSGWDIFVISNPTILIEEKINSFKRDIDSLHTQAAPLMETLEKQLPGLPENVKAQLREQIKAEIEALIISLNTEEIEARPAIEAFMQKWSQSELQDLPELPALLMTHYRKNFSELQQVEEKRLKEEYVQQLSKHGLSKEAVDSAGTRLLQDLRSARDIPTFQVFKDAFANAKDLSELQILRKEFEDSLAKLKPLKLFHSQEGLAAAKQNVMQVFLAPLPINVNLFKANILQKYIKNLESKDPTQVQAFIQNFTSATDTFLQNFNSNFSRLIQEGKEEEALNRLDRLYERLPPALAGHAEKLFKKTFPQ